MYEFNNHDGLVKVMFCVTHSSNVAEFTTTKTGSPTSTLTVRLQVLRLVGCLILVVKRIYRYGFRCSWYAGKT